MLANISKYVSSDFNLNIFFYWWLFISNDVMCSVGLGTIGNVHVIGIIHDIIISHISPCGRYGSIFFFRGHLVI